MRKFIVTETNIPEFMSLKFEIMTEIRQHVVLPFTKNTYRCIMFDGIRVRLINDDDYIIGVIT